MDALLFLLILVAGGVAVRSERSILVLGAYAVAFVGVALMFAHHVTDPLVVNL